MARREEGPCRDIPVQNVYFMLCYAWGCRHWMGECPSARDGEFYGVGELLSYLLAREASKLVTEALGKEYRAKLEFMQSPNGRIDAAQSLMAKARQQHGLYCEADSFTIDNALNGMIAYSLRRVDATRRETARLVEKALPPFSEVGEVVPTRELVSRIRWNSQNDRYRLAIHLCNFLYERQLPSTQQGEATMTAFDEKTLNLVFENFARAFFRTELPKAKGPEYCVQARHRCLDWATAPKGPRCFIMPQMETDIWIERAMANGKKCLFIIEAKYYKEARHKGKNLRSDNLYQLFSYMVNAREELGERLSDLHGCLLYPLNGAPLWEDVGLTTGMLHVRTINLGVPWPDVIEQMMKVFDSLEEEATR